LSEICFTTLVKNPDPSLDGGINDSVRVET